MAGEIIGDILGAVFEVGLGAASESKRCGCLIILIMLALVGGIVYFYSNAIENKSNNDIKGIITNKASSNRVLVKTNKGEDIYTLSNELYLNKKVGDSIIIAK